MDKLAASGAPLSAPSGDQQASSLPTLALLLITVAAMFYNAGLAMVAAAGAELSSFHVMAVEAAILAAAGLLLLGSARRQEDAAPALLLAFFMVGALVISLVSEGMFLPMVRSAMVIAVFLMLGYRLREGGLRLTVAVAAGLVFAGLILEIASPSLYVRLFEPARYYEMTRGIEQLETVDGLFRNASGFEGRFAIAQILNHRAGSIFLEPVSLGNFGVLLLGFLLCFWKRIGRVERIGYCAMIGLVLLATNSRLLLGFLLLAPAIVLAGGLVSRGARLLIMPAILGGAAVLYLVGPEVEGDNLIGRIGLAMRNLAELDLAGLLGAQPYLAASATDSGYAYLLYAGSVFGLIALWLFVSLVVPDLSARQRRVGLFLTLFVFLSLLISGNSTFSIKAAALLWLIVGVVAAAADPVRAPVAEPRSPTRATGSWRQGARPAGYSGWRKAGA